MNKNPNYEDRSTTLHGVLVELTFERQQDGSYVSSCFLSITTSDGDYSGSLGLCEYSGGIPYMPDTGPDNGPELYAMPEHQIAAIARWAESNGY